jgi:hypothetical protein
MARGTTTGDRGSAATVAERGSAAPVAIPLRWLDDVTAATVLARHVYVKAAPNTYQVVSVQIPQTLPRSGEGHVEIVPRDGFTILGARKWALSALEGRTSLVVTIGVPSNARAGLLTAAEAQFYVAGSPIVAIAIEIDITLVRDLAVRMHAEPLRARAGSRVTFAYELVNTGNATETVETPVVTPKGWTARLRTGTRISVEPGESADRRAEISIPRDVGSGSFFLRLDVLDQGVVRSTIPVVVEVTDELTRQDAAGPEVTIAIAHAVDGSTVGSTVTTASISGPLFDSVRINARVSLGQPSFGASGVALSHLGSYRIAPSLELSAPSGRLTVGKAGNSLSDLTGLYMNGRGVALDAHRGGWHLIGLGARSESSPASYRTQPMMGLRADVDVGRARLMTSASHLRDGELSRRRLDAFGIGASVDAGSGTTVQGEVARRSYGLGEGTGWSAEMTRGDSKGSARVQLTHAPGGSEAFARAVDEVAANVWRTISRRLSFSGSAWRLSDMTAVFSRLRFSGWALRPEYRIHSSTTLAIEAHYTDVSAELASNQSASHVGYGSAERQVGVSANSNVGRFFASGSVATGSATRTIAFETPTQIGERSPRIWWNGLASWRGERSLLESHARMEEMRDPSGAVRRQLAVSLRGSHSFPAPTGRGPSAEWELQQLRGFTARPTTIVRSGITVPVTEMLAVRLYAERNPLFTTGSGRSPWTFALRVERSTRLPMVRPPGSSGYVYHDVNGNQRRDDDEPGIDGAVVRRGSEVAVTDAHGHYRLAGDTRSAIVLDEGSLPLRWVRQSSGSRDIAVGSSLSAEIQFFVAPRSSIESIEVDLSGIRAMARDSSGKVWVARMTGPAVATFEALPPGIYTIELDLSGVDEMLVPRIPLPLLRVSALEATSVTVILDPRPLRMWKAEPAGGQQPAPSEPTTPGTSDGRPNLTTTVRQNPAPRTR